MEAVDVKASIEDPELGKITGGASASSLSGSSQKIYNSITTTNTQEYGGSPGADTKAWLASLPNSPIIADQNLDRLDMLIIDELDGEGKQARVKAVIDKILGTQGLQKASALVVLRAMSHAADDGGSRAHSNIVTSNVQVSDGWYSLGQYAQGDPIDNAFRNPSTYKGVMIKEAPSVSPRSLIRKPTHLNYKWGKSSSWEIYEMSGDDANLYPLSSFFFRTNKAQLPDAGAAALILSSLLIGYSSYSQLWTDKGSKVRDSGSVWAIHGPADADMSYTPTSSTPSYLFRSQTGYGAPGYPSYQLDFSKIAVLSDSFVANLP